MLLILLHEFLHWVMSLIFNIYLIMMKYGTRWKEA